MCKCNIIISYNINNSPILLHRCNTTLHRYHMCIRDIYHCLTSIGIRKCPRNHVKIISKRLINSVYDCTEFKKIFQSNYLLFKNESMNSRSGWMYLFRGINNNVCGKNFKIIYKTKCRVSIIGNRFGKYYMLT